MELWDVYDESRRKTGNTHVRGVPMEEGEYHLISDIWVVDELGNVLITRRHPKKTYGLMWECSGGSVLKGETSLQGAVRELAEETGIHVREEDLNLIHTIQCKDRFVDTYITRQKVSLKDLTLQPEEVVDAKLVTFRELLGMWDQGIVVPKTRFLLYKDSICAFITPPS
jgi:8-oxo-dGTP pyrophosphatase MutT (NUDIX family)